MEGFGRQLYYAFLCRLLSVTAGFLLNVFMFKFSTAGPTIAILSAVLFGLSLLARTK